MLRSLVAFALFSSSPTHYACPQVLLGPVEFEQACARCLKEVPEPFVAFLSDENGGVAGLVALLASTDHDAQAQAAWALSCMSITQPRTRRPMITSGAPARLVAMLRPAALLHSSYGAVAVQAATTALRHLALDGRAGVDALISAGAVEALAGAVRGAPAGPSGNLLQTHALEVLQNLAYMANGGHRQLDSPLLQPEVLATIVGALRSPAQLVAATAAGVMETLARAACVDMQVIEPQAERQRRETMQRKVAAAGGIQALVAAIQHDSSAIMAPAAQALGCLCVLCPANASASVAAGAIAPLCSLLKRPAPAAAHTAAVRLISGIAASGTAAQRAKLAASGAIGGMCVLLQSNDAETPKATASALANMCQDKPFCDEAVAAGAVPRLAMLLCSPAAVNHALSALRNIAAFSSAKTRGAISAAIPSVVPLLHRSQPPIANERAVAILYNLVRPDAMPTKADIESMMTCLDAMVDAGAVAPLVGLLGSEPSGSIDAIYGAAVSFNCAELSCVLLEKLACTGPNVAPTMIAAGLAKHKRALERIVAGKVMACRAAQKLLDTIKEFSDHGRTAALGGDSAAEPAARSAAPSPLAAAPPADDSPCCAACGQPEGMAVKLKRCSGCHAVRYCGADCQRAHWRAHKAACRAAAAKP